MKKFLSLLLIMAMVLSLAACGSSSSSDSSSSGDSSADTTSESGEKELVIGYYGSYDTFCPSTGLSDTSDILTYRLVYDPIFEVNDETLETESRVLESYEWVDDYTYKLVLKQGITYEDGSEMIGEDILNSLQMYVENEFTEMGMYSVIDFDASYVEDTYTVYIVYTEVNSAAVTRLAVPIVDKDVYDAYPDGDDIWWAGDVNGSGPYTVTDYAIDEYIVLEKKDDYWDDSVEYDADVITIQFYTDGSAMVSDLENGAIDIALNITSSDIDTIEATANENIVVDTISTYDVTKLIFNNNLDEMTDINLRAAIAHAVNWSDAVEAAYANLGTLATSHWTEGYDCYVEHEGYEYDPDLALEYLEAAGYSEGELTLQFLASDDTQQAIGEIMQAYLAEIGVTLEVTQMELAAAFEYYNSGEVYQMIISCKPTGNPDRDPYDDGCLPTSTMVLNHIYDDEYSDLMTTANATRDDEERASVYAELDDWLYEQYQAIPIAETLDGYAYNSDVISDVTLCSFYRGNLANIKLN